MPSVINFTNPTTGKDVLGTDTTVTPNTNKFNVDPQLTFPTDKADIYGVGEIPSFTSIHDLSNRFKAGSQSDWEKFRNVIGRGVPKGIMSMVEPIGYLADMEHYIGHIDKSSDEYSNWFNEWLQKQSDALDEAMPIYTEDERPNIGSKDWWFKNGDQVIKSMGYFVPAMGITKGASALLKALKVTGDWNKALSIGASATAMNYSEHMVSATQAFKENQPKYLQFAREQGMPINEALQYANDQASKDAAGIVQKGKINILLNMIEYNNLFKIPNATRAIGEIGKKATAERLLGTAFSEALEEVNTGYFESEAKRNMLLNTKQIEDDGSTEAERWLNHVSSYEGLTEGILGAVGGAGMQMFSEIGNINKSKLAKQQIANTELELGKADKFNANELNDRFKVYYKNAQAGTYESVINNLQRVQEYSQEEADKLGFKEDYKEKAQEYISEAEQFEKDYNELSYKYQDTPNVAHRLLINRYLERDYRKQHITAENNIEEIKKEYSKPERSNPTFDFKVRNLTNTAKAQVIANANELLTQLDENDSESRTLDTNETKDELLARIGLLKQELESEQLKLNEDTQKYIEKATNKTNASNEIKKALGIVDQRDTKLYTATLEREAAKSQADNFAEHYKNITKDATSINNFEKESKKQYSDQLKQDLESFKTLVNNTTSLEELDKIKPEAHQQKIFNNRRKILVEEKKVRDNKAKNKDLKKNNRTSTEESKESQPAASSINIGSDTKTSNESKQAELENKVTELQAKRDALRSEDGSVSNENLKTWKDLGHEVLIAKYAATRGTNDSHITIKSKPTSKTNDPQILIGEDAINAENDIENIIAKGIKDNKVISDIMEEILSKYTFNANVPNKLNNYIYDRKNNTPEIGNNKQPFQIWRTGKQDETSTPTLTEEEVIANQTTDGKTSVIPTSVLKNFNNPEVYNKNKTRLDFVASIIFTNKLKDLHNTNTPIESVLSEEELAIYNIVKEDVISKYNKWIEDQKAIEDAKNKEAAIENLDNNDRDNISDDGYVNDEAANSITSANEISAEEISTEDEIISFGASTMENGHLVERDNTGRIIRVDFKQVDGAYALAYLSREYTTVVKFTKDGIKVYRFNSKNVKNSNLLSELETDKINETTEVRYSIDESYELFDESGTLIESYETLKKLYKDNQEEWINTVPILVEFKIGNEWYAGGYVHETAWIRDGNNVAEYISDGNGGIINNYQEQLDNIVERRKTITSELNEDNKFIYGKVEHKSMGHAIPNLKLTKEGNPIYRKSTTSTKPAGKPLLERKPVSEMFTSKMKVGGIAISTFNPSKNNYGFVTSTGVQIEPTFNKQSAETVAKKYPGYTWVVVEDANGITRVLPLIAPTISFYNSFRGNEIFDIKTNKFKEGSNNIYGSLINLVTAYFSNQDLTNINKNRQFINRDDINTLREILDNYLYLHTEELDIDKTNRYYIDVKDNQLVIGDHSSELEYKIGFENGSLTSTHDINKIIDKFSKALQSNKFSTKISKLNSKKTVYEPIFVSKDGVVELSNVNTYNNYIEFIGSKLYSLYREDALPNGKKVAFEQPNVITSVNKVAKSKVIIDNKEVENKPTPKVRIKKNKGSLSATTNNNTETTLSTSNLNNLDNTNLIKGFNNQEQKEIVQTISAYVYADYLDTLENTEGLEDDMLSIFSRYEQVKQEFEETRDDLREVIKEDNSLYNQKLLEAYELILEPNNWNKLVLQSKTLFANIGLTSKIDNTIESEESVYETNKYDDNAKFKIDYKQLASNRFKLFLMRIPEIRFKDGVPLDVENRLGFNKLVDIDITFNDLHSVLADKGTTLNDLINALQDNVDVNPVYQTIIDYLNKDTHSKDATEFLNIFAKNRRQIIRILYSPIYSKTIFNEYGNPDLLGYRAVPYLTNDATGWKSVLEIWKESQKTSELVKPLYAGEYGIDNASAANIKNEYSKFLKSFKPEDIRTDEFITGLQAILNKIGIVVNKDALVEFSKSNKYVNDLITDGNGLMGNIFSAFESNTNNDEDNNVIGKNNPLYNSKAKQSLNRLARLQYKHSDLLPANTVLNNDGDLINEMSEYNYLTNTLRRLLIEDGQLLKDKTSTSFGSKSLYADNLQQLYKDGYIKYIGDIDAFVKTHVNKKDDAFNRIDLNEVDKLLLPILMYQNGNNNKVGYYILPTLGDSSNSTAISLPKLETAFNFHKGLVTGLSNDTLDYLMDAVSNEIYRIDYFNNNIKDTEGAADKYGNYYHGADKFFLFPYLNKNVLTKEQQEQLYANDRLIVNDDTIGIIRKIVEQNTINEINDTIARFEESKVISRDSIKEVIDGVEVNGKSSNFKTNMFDYNYMQSLSKAKIKFPVSHAIADFYLNNKISIVEQHILFYGDPALYNQPNKDGSLNFDKTLVNLQKRLKGIISPFQSGNWIRPTVNIATVNDRIVKSNELVEYTNRGITNGYTSMKSTDAGELLTVREGIEEQLAYGNITKEQYDDIITMIDSGNSDKILSKYGDILFNPTKPIIFTENHDPSYDVNTVFFRKTGSIILFPELTKGLELDRLRLAMENQGIDRLGYVSSDKVGASNVTTIWEGNRLVDDIKLNATTLSRDNIGFQMKLPDGKTKVSLITQLNKVVFNGIRDIKFGNVTGRDLELQKDAIRQKLIKIGRDKILDEFDITIDKSTGEFIFNDLEKLNKVLLKEANARGWSVTDIQQLKVINNEFAYPLLYNNSYKKIQSLILNIITDRTIKTKMFGRPFIQASSAGFVPLKVMGDSQIADKSGIVYTSQFKNKLRHISNDTNNRSQIFVSWNFKDNNGNLLDINDYITDGIIDFEKLPRELLQGIGARIPNQSHSSNMGIEIVGFLPYNMSDLVIVADEVVDQMGSDFDIDKLYSYLNQYYEVDGKLVKLTRDSLNYIEELTNKIKEDKEFIRLNKELEKTANKVSDDTKILDKLDELNIEVRKDIRGYYNILNLINEENILKQEYVDIFNTILTNEEIANLSLQPLDKDDIAEEFSLLVDKGKRDITSFLYQNDSYYNQVEGKSLVAITSVYNVFNSILDGLNNINSVRYDSDSKQIVNNPVKFTDNDGNLIELTEFAGKGKSYYNDEIRSKSDNIVLLQNAAVDNANKPFLGGLNINSYTIGVASTMVMMNSKNGVSLDITYVTRMMKQPIIEKYVKYIKEEINNGKTLYEAKDNVYYKLITEYQLMISKDFGYTYIPFNSDELLANIKGNKEGEAFVNSQLSVLQTFYQLDALADTINTAMNSTTYALRKGSGKTIFDAQSILDNIESTITSGNISNLGKVLGSVSGFGRKATITFNTEDGIATSEVLEFSNKMMYNLFKLNEDSIESITSSIKNITKGNGQNLSGREIEAIVDELRKYVLSGTSSLLGINDISIKRAQLLFDTSNNKSLGTRITNYLKAKDNIFLRNHLIVKKGNSELDPVLVQHDNINSSKLLTQQDKINMFLEVLGSDDIELSNIGKDLIYYTYLTSGIFNPVSFTNLIPVEILDLIGFDKSLRNVNIDATDVNRFLDQYFQHNPNRVTQFNANIYSKKILKDGELTIGYKTKLDTPIPMPKYISEFVSNSWRLYKLDEDKGGYGTYIRLDTLGNANKAANHINEYDRSKTIQKSYFKKNKAVVVTDELMKSFIDETTKPNTSSYTLSNDSDITNKYFNTNSLSKALNNIDHNPAFKTIGQVLSNYILVNRLKTNINTENMSINYDGKFNNNTVTINNNAFTNPNDRYYRLEQTILHEGSHAVIDQLIKNHRTGKNTEQQDIIIDNLLEIYKNTKDQLIKDPIVAEILIKNERVANGSDEKLTANERKYYGLSEFKEFIPELFSNKDFQRILNSKQFTGSRNTKFDKSILDKIIELISKLIKSIADQLHMEAIDTNSNLEYALKDAISLLTTIPEIEATSEPTSEPISDSKIDTRNIDNGKLDNLNSKQLDLFDDNFSASTQNINEVNKVLKSVEILTNLTPKQQIEWNKFNKGNLTIQQLSDKLQIPKQQQEFLTAVYKKGMTADELALEIASVYNYSVEVKTAKDRISNSIEFNAGIVERDGKYYMSDPDTGTWDEISKQTYDEFLKAYNDNTLINSKHYNYLTVPGGTNYTENRIITPLITPTLKGHPQFAEDNDIGWFRSDDESPVMEGMTWLQDTDMAEPSTNTRRILEIQSDLFQKGRGKEDLINSNDLIEIKDGEILTTDKGTFKLLNRNYNNGIYTFTVENISNGQVGTISREKLLNGIKAVQKNKFLQLLNKDNNWVKFFIKSIIQDSVKKGYSKVLFPKGETAAKIEGHETIAEQIRRIDLEIESIKKGRLGFDKTELGKEKEIKTGQKIEEILFAQRPGSNRVKEFEQKGYITNIRIDVDTPKLRATEQEKANLKSQGIEKLKPIEAFYEIKIGNILEKQFGKNNVKTITDEYGNQWRELELNAERDLLPISFSAGTGQLDMFEENLHNKARELSKNIKPKVEDNTITYRFKQEKFIPYLKEIGVLQQNKYKGNYYVSRDKGAQPNEFKRFAESNKDYLENINITKFYGYPVFKVTKGFSEAYKVKIDEAQLLKANLRYNAEMKKDGNSYSASTNFRFNTKVESQIPDTIKSLILNIQDRRTELENKINESDNYIFYDRLSPQEKINYKNRMFNLRQRVSELTRDLERLRDGATTQIIEEIANRHIDYAKFILKSPNVTPRDLLFADNITKVWSLTNAENYMTDDQRANPENSRYQLFVRLNGEVSALSNQIMDRARQVVLKSINDSTNSKLTADDLKYMTDINALVAWTLDSTKSKNPLVQKIGELLRNANRHEGILVEYQKEINEIFKPIQKLKHITGDNYELFWNEDGGMVEEYDTKWRNFLNTINSRWNILYNQPKVNGKYSKEQLATINNILADYRKNVITIDLVALGRAQGSRLLPNYTFKTAKDYRDYLHEELGKETADNMIAQADLKHQDYLNDLANATDNIYNDDFITDKDAAIEEWINTNSPIVYLNNMYGDAKDRVNVEKNIGYKYLMDAPRRTINKGGKKIDTGYYNKNFDTILNTPELKEFYYKHNELMARFIGMLPNSVTKDLSGNFLAQVQKEALLSYGVTGVSSALKVMNRKFIDGITDNDIIELNSTQERADVQRDIDTGKIKHSIPTKFIKPLKEDANRSFDLEANLLLFANMATNYAFKNEVEDSVLLLQKIALDARELETSATGNKILNSANKAISIKGELGNLHEVISNEIDNVMYNQRKRKEGVTKKVLYTSDKVDVKVGDTTVKMKRAKRAKDIQSRANYINALFDDENRMANLSSDQINEYNKELADLNKEYTDLEGKALSMGKIGEQLMAWTQLKGLGLNFTAGIANLLFGMISNMTHANGREDFNNSQFLQAFGIVLKSKSNRNHETNKVYNLVKRFGILFDVIDSRYNNVEDVDTKVGKSGKMAKFIKDHELSPYIFQSKTEYLIQSMSFIAKLINTKVDGKYTIDDNEKSMYEIYNDDGTINNELLNEEGIQQYSYLVNPNDRNEYSKIRDNSIQMNKLLHGNYDPSSTPLAKRYIVGRMLFQFRSWMPEGFANRFQEHRYDNQLGREVKGRWVTYADLGIFKSLGTLLKQAAYMDSAFKDSDGNYIMERVDIENMRRNLAELASWGSIVFIMTMLKYAIDGDDDDDMQAGMIRILINAFFRSQQDIYTYISPSTFYNVIHDPIPVTKIILDAGKTMDGLYRYATDGTYKGNVMNKILYNFPYANQIPKVGYLATNSYW